jgi:hypothetical protein
MPKPLFELLALTEQTMAQNIKKKHGNFDLETVILQLTQTDAYLFLRYNENHIDVEQYLITFVRFFSYYTRDIETICRHFELMINNIKDIAETLEVPIMAFMRKPSCENLIQGFLIPEKIKTNSKPLFYMPIEGEQIFTE